MSELPKHPYACVNTGCVNGHMSIFYAAPPEWFAGRGISEPKNCPNCREWRRRQSDSVHKCQGCGYAIRQTVGAKRAFHRHEGAYQVPTHCRRCLDGKKPPSGTRGRFIKKPKLNGNPPRPLTLIAYEELSTYRRQHYGKHVPGHPYSEIGLTRASGNPVSATSIVGVGASSQDFYTAGEELASMTEGVYDYDQGNGQIIKAFIVDDQHVERAVYREVGDGRYEFVTSYDEISISEAEEWR